jgi:hypothetical protein
VAGALIPPLDPLPQSASFRSDKGPDPEGRNVVFGLFEQLLNSRPRFLGTAFFLTTNGLFATARHVVMRTESEPHDPMVAAQLLPGNVVVWRPVLIVAPSRTADVAVGGLAPMANPEGVLLKNKVLTLTTRSPSLGEIASTYAYPNTETSDDPLATYLNPAFAFGRVEAVFPEGRDRTFLPGPCFQTSFPLSGGTSGGPVLDKFGRCFALNSTSFDNGQPSFASSIKSIFGLQLGPAIVVEDANGKLVGPTVQQLIERRYIVVQG